jgi:hypothetical protein
MTNITSRILSVAFALASVVLWISDRIYQLPLPPEVAQYWPLVTAIAVGLVSFQRTGKVSEADVEKALDALIAKPKPPIVPLLVACMRLGGCAEYAVRPSFEYRSRGISASVEYDGKAIRPKVLIYDKGQVDKELKGLAK